MQCDPDVHMETGAGSGQCLAESHTSLVIRFQVRIPPPTSSLEHLATAPTWTTQWTVEPLRIDFPHLVFSLPRTNRQVMSTRS